MSAVATNRTHGATAATELLVLDPVAQRLGLSPIVLSAGEFTLGSAPDCTVRLEVPGVQPRHCVLQSSRQRISVRALDHRTWHNNLPITEGWLKPGDRLAIGPVEFRVRHVEPWDVLPRPETTAVEQPTFARAPGLQSSDSSNFDQINDLEARLLQQIADLESQMSRHHTALDELEQPLQGIANGQRQAADTHHDLPSDETPEAVTSTKFHHRTPLSESSQSAAANPLHADRWQTELEAQQRQARQQLADLSVRHESLNRQCLELGAQWDHLRELIAEQEAATIERSQREQQLYERERRCSFKESDLTQRLQKLQQDQEGVAARKVHAQNTDDQLTQRSVDLQQLQADLENTARQLDFRESQLEQIDLNHQRLQDELAQREAALKVAVEAADTNTATWNELRQATECRWAQRAQELETQAALQLVRIDEVSQREHAVDQLANSLRLEQERLLAERTRLETVQHDLIRREVELAERHAALESQNGQLLIRDEELTQREVAHQQAIVRIQWDREELTAERIRLEALSLELSLTATELADRQCTLSAQAGSLTSQAAELQLRGQSLELVGAKLWHEQEELDSERQRISHWQSELEIRQSELLEQQQLCTQHADRLQLETADLNDRARDLEQRSASLQMDQAALISERNHLQTWTEILSAQQSELAATQREAEVQSLELQSQAAEIQQQADALRQQAAAVQREREELQVGLDRFAAWNEELITRQSDLAQQQSDLAQQQRSLVVQSENNSSQFSELLEREKSAAEAQANLEDRQSLLATEQQRLSAWNDALQYQQIEIDNRLTELTRQQSVWEQNRRIEASASAAAMTSEYAQLARVREDLTLAERELERVEADLLAFEHELQDRAQELATREVAVTQDEIECAWQSRAAELLAADSHRLRPDPKITQDVERQLAHLRDTCDALAVDLFATTQYLESESNQAVLASEQLRHQAEHLRHNVDLWQQQSRALHADQFTLESDRQQLQQQRVEWEQNLQSRQSAVDSKQHQLAEQSQQLQAREAQLQARESQWKTERARFDAAQQELELQAQSLADQQAELHEQTRLVELQRQELAQSLEHQAQQLTQFADVRERGTEHDRELEAARMTLRREQAQLEAAQLELDRERLAWEQERQTWRDNQANNLPLVETDDSTPALETLSQLDDLIQEELNHDVAPGGMSDDVTDYDRSMDILEAARRQYQSLHSDEELGADARELHPENEEHAPERPRSLWSADRPTDETFERPNVSELPKTEEDLSVLDLRARLAKMFNLELNSGESAEDNPTSGHETDMTVSAEEIQDAGSLEANQTADNPESYRDSLHSAAIAAELRTVRPEPARAETTTEPSLDEYDSVESYMARLLDRNRRSRTGEDPVAELFVPSPAATPLKSRNVPATAPPMHEFDDSVPEPMPTEPEPEVVDSVPTIRKPVDTRKIRAGLDSLRQVANISARHAIARSKWKRMRTKVALQSVLTAGSFVVGLSSLTGNWLGFIGTSLWGWLAIAMGTVLALKLGLDFRWIFYGEHHIRRGEDAAIDSIPEPSELLAADRMSDDAETLGS